MRQRPGRRPRRDDSDAVVAALAHANNVAVRVPQGACAQTRFLIDECVTLLLVDVAHLFGYAADHIAHRGWAKLKDHELRPLVLQYDYTLVTNNRNDWKSIVGGEELHPGLVVLIENAPRAVEVGHFVAVLEFIVDEASLVNRVVEVDARGRVSAYDLPELR